MMCEHCRSIQTWRKFDAPRDYLACIAYIQKLVEQGELELLAEESTCPLDKVRKTEAGTRYLKKESGPLSPWE